MTDIKDDAQEVHPLHAELFRMNRIIFTFAMSVQHWFVAEGDDPFTRKRKTYT